MTRFTELKWAARDATPGSRVVNFSRNGEKRFAALFGDANSASELRLAGLDPAHHDLLAAPDVDPGHPDRLYAVCRTDVDARHKAGHDENFLWSFR